MPLQRKILGILLNALPILLMIALIPFVADSYALLALYAVFEFVFYGTSCTIVNNALLFCLVNQKCHQGAAFHESRGFRRVEPYCERAERSFHTPMNKTHIRRANILLFI